MRPPIACLAARGRRACGRRTRKIQASRSAGFRRTRSHRDIRRHRCPPAPSRRPRRRAATPCGRRGFPAGRCRDGRPTSARMRGCARRATARQAFPRLRGEQTSAAAAPSLIGLHIGSVNGQTIGRAASTSSIEKLRRTANGGCGRNADGSWR